MEQRPLRLGDIVDDYCPRERRITNHAIVALIDNAIRQTRCSTCDAEHVYKGARLPKRRKKDDETLYDQVLAGVGGTPVKPAEPTDAVPAAPDEPNDLQVTRNGQPDAEPANAAAASQPEADQSDDGETGEGDEQRGSGEAWGGHRRLIRASLPKTEGDLPPPRPIPEFTMHHRAHRDGFYRGHGQGGNGPDRDSGRQGRPGNGHGQGGPPQGQGDRPHRGGRGRRHRGRNKRSR